MQQLFVTPMLRKLLALLVLVTGLAAAGTPAQARVFDVESVRTIDAGYVCSAQAGAPNIQFVGSRRERDEAQPKSCPRPPKIVLIVPAVMLQADRARE
jgi:hypothetical protein